MKQLSQTERNEIDRILGARHEAALKIIEASDPNWRERVEEKKNKLAIGRLKVEKEVLALKQLETQIRNLEQQKQEVEARIARKMPLKERDGRYDDSCPTPKSLCQAVAEIGKAIHESVMAKDPAGIRILNAKKAYRDAEAQFAKCSTRDDVVKAKIL